MNNEQCFDGTKINPFDYFLGKSIGKHVFLSRKTGNRIQGIPHDANGDNDAKLRQLEGQFYKSLFQDRDAPAGSIPLSSPYSLAPFLRRTATTVVPPTTNVSSSTAE